MVQSIYDSKPVVMDNILDPKQDPSKIVDGSKLAIFSPVNLGNINVNKIAELMEKIIY